MSGVIRGRLVLQLLLVVIAVALITSLALFTIDISPSFSKVINKMEDLEGAVRDKLALDGGTKVPAVEQIVVPFDQIMKAPVSLAQDDPMLIQRIRSKYMFPPSSEPYPITVKDFDPSKGQSKQIRLALGDEVVKEGGFFVECGALDGVTRSNSLVFEKEFGWKGVLIEGDPKNFEKIPSKNRKAWTVNACLSTKPYPNMVIFKQSFNVGKITDLESGKNRANHAEVQCLPFYSILLALNTTTVDYFSLDVEGAELKVLQTIPWSKVNIKTLSVEFAHTDEGKVALRQYMEGNGYLVYSEVTHPGSLANDFIFVKKELMPKKTEDKKV